MRRAPLLSLTLMMLAPVLSVAEAQKFDSEESRAASISPEYFTLDAKSVTIEKVGDADPVAAPVAPGQGAAPADPIGEIGAIINIGQKVWDIIVANKPVVDVKTAFASAMPLGIKTPDQLSGWQAPQGTVYALKARNVYGAEVINLRYTVLRTWGGRLKGKGRYLTGVTVQPLNVDVLWGYRFSLSAAAPSTTNAGSDADPIAAMMLVLDWKIETPLKESRGSGVYYVQGDGAFKDLGGMLKAHTLMGPLRPPRWDLGL